MNHRKGNRRPDRKNIDRIPFQGNQPGVIMTVDIIRFRRNVQ